MSCVYFYSCKMDTEETAGRKRPRADDGAQSPPMRPLVQALPESLLAEQEVSQALSEADSHLCELLSVSSSNDEEQEEEFAGEEDGDAAQGVDELNAASSSVTELRSQTRPGGSPTMTQGGPLVPTVVEHQLRRQMSSVEVHRIFQEHWKDLEAAEDPFRNVILASLRSEQRKRHSRLVNITNWDADPKDDVLLPESLMDLATYNRVYGRDQEVAAEDDDEDALQMDLGLPMRARQEASHPPPQHDVPPEARRTLRPHQIDGIRFLWRMLVLRPKERVPAIGCILAHSMGLGKTGQVLCFLHLLYKHVLPSAKTLLVLPKSVLSSWTGELEIWSQHFPESPLPGFDVIHAALKKEARYTKLLRWHRDGGVLLIGYEALALLFKDVEKKRTDGSWPKDNKLFQPGGQIDLVICDEGHRLKTQGLQVHSALLALNPDRRLVISGTPLQNHMMEYWAMVEFILPKYFAKKSFRNYFIRPIAESMSKDAKPEIVALAKKRTFTLIKELENYVHRRDNDVLRKELPAIHEFILIVPLTEVQKERYHVFTKCLRNAPNKNLLQAFSYAAKICAHPALLYTNDDFGEDTSSKPAAAKQDDDDDDDVVIILSPKKKQEVQEETPLYQELLTKPEGYQPQSDDSAKLSVAVSLILLAREKGESTLVFSMSTKLLDWFEEMLRQTGIYHCQDPNLISFLRIDGSTSSVDRERQINDFQSGKQKVDVFLLSTKAGGLGITLTQATRVVILDCSWNPADDRQAVGRAYRYGQTKPVYIYRLVCNDTIEHRVFDQKVGKEWLFQTVVDTNMVKRDTLKGPKLQEIFCLAEGTNPVHINPIETERCCQNDDVLAAVRGSVLGVMSHDSLLEEDPIKYGDAEHAYYRDFLRRGGLWKRQTEEEMGELRKKREADEEDVKMQARSLRGVLQALLNQRSAGGTRGAGTSALLSNLTSRTDAGTAPNSGFYAPVDPSAMSNRSLMMRRGRVSGVGSTKDVPVEIDDDDDPKPAPRRPPPPVQAPPPPPPTAGDDESDPVIIDDDD